MKRHSAQRARSLNLSDKTTTTTQRIAWLIPIYLIDVIFIHLFVFFCLVRLLPFAPKTWYCWLCAVMVRWCRCHGDMYAMHIPFLHCVWQHMNEHLIKNRNYVFYIKFAYMRWHRCEMLHLPLRYMNLHSSCKRHSLLMLLSQTRAIQMNRKRREREKKERVTNRLQTEKTSSDSCWANKHFCHRCTYLYSVNFSADASFCWALKMRALRIAS